jgi:hypothetical protein
MMMAKYLIWWLIGIAVIVAGWMWLMTATSKPEASDQSATEVPVAGEQPQETAKPASADIDADLRAADQEADSIDFGADFAADDLNGLGE